MKCEFILNDALRTLSTSKKQSYSSEELDLNYRAALEITRNGELEITVPDLLSSKAKTELPASLPRPCPKDVASRYDKLVRMYHALVSSAMSRRDQAQGLRSDTSPLGMADPVAPSSRTSPPSGALLQVRIVYSLHSLGSSQRGSSGATTGTEVGVVFRRPPPLAALFESTLHRHKPNYRTAMQNKKTATTTAALLPPAVSVYTPSFSTGTLRDVDGVRCWLPCIDALDQRAVYDISITAPRNWRVACAGKKLSTFLVAPTATASQSASAESDTTQFKVSRFFTPNRIAAMSVGFYMGAVEMYKMPLYKVRSRIWVTTRLNDFVHVQKSSGKTSSRNGNREDEEEEGDTNEESSSSSDGGRGEEDEDEDCEPVELIKPLGESYYAGFKRRLPDGTGVVVAAAVTTATASSNAEEETNQPSSKRTRTEGGNHTQITFTAAVSSAKAAETGTANFHKGLHKKPELVPSRLYASKVHHSTLGLDISLRLLHKFTGHKFDYEEFTFVYIHDLGCDSVSFDGFALVDARFLHSEQEVYLETTAHMVLLQAYLYSWLKSALPVCSFDAEFIVHGAVGYLMNFYAEEVYGEEDGRYRYQKMYDTVIALEKQGKGFPLASFFPESYDVFGLHCGTYLRCKSAVIFQLIENRVGGKEHMRISLKQLIRSPPIYNAVQKPYKGANKDIVNNFQSLFESSAVNKGGMSPVLPHNTPPTPSMVNQALVLSEQRYRSYSEDGSYGGMSPYSPYHMGNRSPSTLGGNLSPMSTMSGNLSPYPYYGGNISPYPYNQGGNLSPYPYNQGGGNISPYPHNAVGGNRSPYAPYASYHPTLGAATPMYDPYGAHASAAAGLTAAGGAPCQQTYSPNRYEITNSPLVAACAEKDKEIDPASHLLAPLPTSHLESDDVKAANMEPGSTSVIVDPTEESKTFDSSSAGVKVTVPVVDAASEPAVAAPTTGFYAAMVQREQRLRSNSITADQTSATEASPPPPSEEKVEEKEKEREGRLKISLSRLSTAASAPSIKSATAPAVTTASTAAPPAPAMVRQHSEGSATGGDMTVESNWSMLACECVSPESFILTVRHASGASADIGDEFLENCVYKSGALFLRVHVSMSEKVEGGKPRQIFVDSEQVGYKEGGFVDKKHSEKQEIKMRIAEARDDVVTEPVVTFTSKEEQFQQQAYTRPGRRGGKRRGPGKKGEETIELDAKQLEEIARRTREREERKSALMRARDVDYPLRYALLDPACQRIIESYNASADVLLIEQLYTDFFENNVYFQCQALRSLSRAGTSNVMITADISADAAAAVTGATADGSRLGSGFGLGSSTALGGGAPTAVKIPEKSAKMQLRALSDCLMGVPTLVNDPKHVNGTQFSIYIRAEAAMGLARWQNERAPRALSAEVSAGGWQALEMLNEHLHSMYADAHTQQPLPSDFANESSTHLRNAMLLALSSIKAKSGHSPVLVTETILKFTRASEASDEQFENPSMSTGINSLLDDAHYKSVLFLALGRLRFESIPPGEWTTHPVQEIVSLAQSTIDVSFTRARATARIKLQRGDANLLPSLPGSGLEVATAISCLAEMDIHACALYAKGRATPQGPVGNSGSSSSSSRTFSSHSLKDVDGFSPTGRGPLSGFNYVRHFLPPSARVTCLLNDPQGGRSQNVAKAQINFFMCSPSVRVAAFEGFVRLCFAMEGAHEERRKALSAMSSTQRANTATTFIPAAIESLSVLLRVEANPWVRQQAAAAMLDAIMNRPARAAAQAIAQSNFWYCVDWSDPSGLTLQPADRNISTYSGKKCLNALHGDYALIGVKLLWKLIISSMSFEQVD